MQYPTNLHYLISQLIIYVCDYINAHCYPDNSTGYDRYTCSRERLSINSVYNAHRLQFSVVTITCGMIVGSDSVWNDTIALQFTAYLSRSVKIPLIVNQSRCQDTPEKQLTRYLLGRYQICVKRPTFFYLLLSTIHI